MLNSLEVLPIYPAMLCSQAMDEKNLLNNLYLYQAITKDVDIGGRTCNHCGLNLHMKCAFRDPNITETVFWTCLHCQKKNSSAKIPATDITNIPLEINTNVSNNLN